jgi:choline kinase
VKAIILAAGMGSRLRPLTDDKPKCLVELDKIPLLDRQLEVLKSAGISNVHVIGGYLGHMLKRPNVTLHMNENYESTNMVETLFCAEEVLQGTQDIIISYGDIVYEPRVLQKLISSEAEVSVAADLDWLRYWYERMPNPLVDVETFVVDESDRIIELGQRPESLDVIEGQFMGLIKFRSDSLPKLRKAWLDARHQNRPLASSMSMTDFLQMLIDRDWDVRASFVSGGWAEVDSVQDLRVASQNLRRPHP